MMRAVSSASDSLIVVANEFQLFQPMGGFGARCAVPDLALPDLAFPELRLPELALPVDFCLASTLDDTTAGSALRPTSNERRAKSGDSVMMGPTSVPICPINSTK